MENQKWQRHAGTGSRLQWRNTTVEHKLFSTVVIYEISDFSTLDVANRNSGDSVSLSQQVKNKHSDNQMMPLFTWYLTQFLKNLTWNIWETILNDKRLFWKSRYSLHVVLSTFLFSVSIFKCCFDADDTRLLGGVFNYTLWLKWKFYQGKKFHLLHFCESEHSKGSSE